MLLKNNYNMRSNISINLHFKVGHPFVFELTGAITADTTHLLVLSTVIASVT